MIDSIGVTGLAAVLWATTWLGEKVRASAPCAQTFVR